jgi:glucose-1-phosphate thymidylyltransferase
MLHANARLLRLDYGSQDAIERSYAEDFTVLPPVFLHETAVIENSVIGPFVNLEAYAKVQNSIVRNSLIGKGTLVTDVIIDKSLIGDDAVITGLKSVVIADDGSIVNLSKE